MDNNAPQEAGPADGQQVTHPRRQAPPPARVPGQRVNEFTRYPQEVKEHALQLIDQVNNNNLFV